MKKVLLFAGVALLFLVKSYAQDPPVTANLQLYYEVLNNPSSFIPGSAGKKAFWLDRSGNGLDVESQTPWNHPQFVSNVLPGINAVRFLGHEAMVNNRSPFTAFTGTEATLFAVRISNTRTRAYIPNGTIQPLTSILSIAGDEPGNPGSRSWEHEFLLSSNTAKHHTSNGQFSIRQHQCWTNASSPLPTNKPAVVTARLGTAGNDIDYWLNDDMSTLPVFPPGTASPAAPYLPISRNWTMGARWSTGFVQEFFTGDIIEILAYDRRLTDQEVHQVNEYLKCKYKINYMACNPVQAMCPQCLNNLPAPRVTSSLTTNYVGTDINGDCEFTAIANVSLVAGQTIIGYEWTAPGQAPVRIPGVGGNTFTFSLPHSTTTTNNTGTVTVRVYTYDSGHTPINGDLCCDFTMTADVWCDNVGVGGVN